MKSVKVAMVSVGLLILTAVSGLAWGENNTYPFTGAVTGNSVYVRSGPDSNYFPTSRLMRGNKVTVVGQEYDWYKIVPPEGSFSWVSKDYVEKKEGNKGVTTGDRLSIRAGSHIKPEVKSAIQMAAGKGLEVTILGEDGDWYKIAPPEGAFLWVSAKYVKAEAGEKPAAAVAEKTPPTTQPTNEAVVPTPKAKAVKDEPLPELKEKTIAELTTQPATPPALPGVNRGEVVLKRTYKSSTTLPFAGEDMNGKYTQKIQELDREFLKEMKKPLPARKFDRFESAFKEIADQKENKAAARFAKDRLAMIDYQKQAQKGIGDLTNIEESFTREVESWKGPILKDSKEINPDTYRLQGTGVLRPSLVFEGPLMPKRFRLFDAEKGRTVAYVELAPGTEINLSQYLGRQVAVYGTATIDAKLGFKVILADAFKILEESSKITNSSSLIP